MLVPLGHPCALGMAHVTEELAPDDPAAPPEVSSPASPAVPAAPAVADPAGGASVEQPPSTSAAAKLTKALQEYWQCSARRLTTPGVTRATQLTTRRAHLRATRRYSRIPRASRCASARWTTGT